VCSSDLQAHNHPDLLVAIASALNAFNPRDTPRLVYHLWPYSNLKAHNRKTPVEPM